MIYVDDLIFLCLLRPKDEGFVGNTALLRYAPDAEPSMQRLLPWILHAAGVAHKRIARKNCTQT